MSGRELWYLRGDGQKLAVIEGSPAHQLMVKDGGFKPLGRAGEIEPDLKATPGPPDLAKMKKAELLEYAAERGIEVSPKATVAAIIEVIQAAEVEQEG